MENIKGAVLLYGITRDQGKAVSESFRSTILNLFKNNNIECDIYIHAWILDSKISSYIKEENNLEIKNQDDWKLFKPDFFKTEKQSDFDESINYKTYIDNSGLDYGQDNDQKIINYVRALFSLQKCYAMTNNKNYNFFFVARLDTIFKTNEGLVNSISCAHKSKVPLIHTPCWHHWGGFNDRMCIANLQGAELYCNRINQLKNYKKINPNHKISINSKPFNSEKFLFNLVASCKIQHECFNAKSTRIRVDGSSPHFDRKLINDI